MVGPVKTEGDARSPAGIFKVRTTFGFSPKTDNKFKFPHLSLTENSVCVDDEKSSYYNQVIDKSKINNPDWNSGEQMRQVDVYKQGAIISYNESKPVHGAGSCIFMHIWRNPTSGTAGCVAMKESNLHEILGWFSIKKSPVIAILTSADYSRFRKKWNLP